MYDFGDDFILSITKLDRSKIPKRSGILTFRNKAQVGCVYLIIHTKILKGILIEFDYRWFQNVPVFLVEYWVETIWSQTFGGFEREDKSFYLFMIWGSHHDLMVFITDGTFIRKIGLESQRGTEVFKSVEIYVELVDEVFDFLIGVALVASFIFKGVYLIYPPSIQSRSVKKRVLLSS